jgi:xylan 1,4-beta-xylosidase
VGKNTEFWKAAGSDYLFSHSLLPAGQALLDRMEATQSHRFLRTHHTFVQDRKKGMIRGQNVYSEDKNGHPVYDFSKVNQVFAEYVKRGLKPIVEYDYLPQDLEITGGNLSQGNDEGMKMRNTGPRDWQKWSDLMKAATRNFIAEFGQEEVRSWYFEVWNEPDGWPIEELDVFFKMYDVFVDAVLSVDPELKVGGPACYHEYFLRPFLHHVVHGKNHVTGETGTRIDFISYHIYGLSGKWLNEEPHIQPQVQRFSQSMLWLKRLLKEFPELKGTALHINEWGMSSNFWRTEADHPDLAYRNTHESALFLVKLVNSFYQLEDNHNFPTTLLLYWGFAGEAEKDAFFVGERELTTAGNIPKPIQTGFEMLARLKENRLAVERSEKDNHLGLLATGSAEQEISFLLYNYEENERDLDRADASRVTIQGLRPEAAYTISEISLDASTHNTYAAWQKLGSPPSSRGVDITSLESASSLQPAPEITRMSDGEGSLSLTLLLPRHSLKLITVKPK